MKKKGHKLELLQRLWDEYTALVSSFEQSIDFVQIDEDAEMLTDILTDTDDMERLREELSEVGVKNIGGV